MTGTAMASSIEITNVNGTAKQGETYNDYFTITNNNETINITLKASDLTNGNNTISSEKITLNPGIIENMKTGEEKNITISIEVPEETKIGTYTGIIIAITSNGTTTSNFTSNITLEVKKTNHAPEFTSTPVTTATKNQEYEYQATASDQDGDELTFSLSKGPEGMTITNKGLVKWTPTETGDYEVKILVSDGESITEQSWIISVQEPVYKIKLGDAIIGGKNQERDETTTTTITIKNTGTGVVNNLELIITADNKYKINASLQKTSLNPGEETSIILQAYVPEDQDAGNKKIGVITVKGTSNGQEVITNKELYMEAKNHLEIDDVDITIDGKKKNLDDGDSFDAKPGDEVSLKIKVKNTYDENIDIEDVEVSVDSDSELDFDETENINRIRDDDTETVKMDFEVPVDVDYEEAPFEVRIRVEGEDENGAKHEEEWAFEIDIDKEKHELRITNININSNCEYREALITTEIINTGRSDEDEGVLLIRIEDLGIEEITKNIELDEGEETTIRTKIRLPDNVKEGTYEVEARAYTSSNSNDLTDTKTTIMELTNCYESQETSTTVDNKEEKTSISVITQPTTQEGYKVISTSTGVKKSSKEETYTTILLVLVIILLIAVIILAGKLMTISKKNNKKTKKK